MGSGQQFAFVDPFSGGNNLGVSLARFRNGRPVRGDYQPLHKQRRQQKYRDLFVDNATEIKNINSHRARLYQQVKEEAAASTLKYDDPKAGYRSIPLPWFESYKNEQNQTRVRGKIFRFNLYRKTPKDKQRFFGNLLISRPFAVGCGLTVMGSFMSAIIGWTGMPIIAAAALGLPFLFITAIVNWRITKKKIPQIMNSVFLGTWFKNLFRYSESEYEYVLKSYFAKLDDNIEGLREKLRRFNDEAKDRNGRLSWWKDRQRRRAEQELQALLEKRANGEVPARQLPWYKRAIVLVSLPLNIAGGAIFGVLTYALAGESLAVVLGLILGASVMASPFGGFLLTGLCILLGVVTAPAISSIFIYGVSGLVKVRNGMKKAGTFILDFFRTEVPNPNGQGTVKKFTIASVAKGVLISVGLSALTGLVTFGQTFQMIGGGKVFLDLFNGGFYAFSMYILPAMACAAQLPFYWLQTFKTGKGWFTNGLDYFRNPIGVINKKILLVEEFKNSGELGAEKAKLIIEQLEQDQATFAYQEQELQNKSVTIRPFKYTIGLLINRVFNKNYQYSWNYGKLLVKLPFWARDILNFQLPRTMNAVGNGFISLYGALSGGGAETATPIDDGTATNPITPSTPDSAPGMTIEAGLAITGGTAASFAAASKDSADTPPAVEMAKLLDKIRVNRNSLFAQHGYGNMYAQKNNEKTPLLAAFSPSAAAV